MSPTQLMASWAVAELDERDLKCVESRERFPIIIPLVDKRFYFTNTGGIFPKKCWVDFQVPSARKKRAVLLGESCLRQMQSGQITSVQRKLLLLPLF